ncbi:ion transporter [Patescibacteria group bacterium]
MNRKNHSNELKNINYELFVFAITILSLINFVILFFVRYDQVREIVIIIDVVLSFIFLGDFFIRLRTAKSKYGYFIRQYGWVDLLGSLPFPSARVLRLFRLVRAYRLLRDLGLKNMFREFIRNRGGTALYLVVFLIILLLEFGSIMVIFSEIPNAYSEINTAQEALWWSFVTITTVGYGDFVPVTLPGRLTGMLMMLVGVGLFGVLTGFLANAFVTPKENDEESEIKTLIKEVKELKQEIKKR